MKIFIALLLLALIPASVSGIQIVNDNNSNLTYFEMRDRTTDVLDTGVVIANLEMYYIEDQAAISADVFVGAHGAVTDAYTSGECIHVGQGKYRADFPDAAFDGGVGTRVQLLLVDGDGGAFSEWLEVELVASIATEVWEKDISSIGGIGIAATIVQAAATQAQAFDPSTTPVEILATGGTAGINAEELIDLAWDELLIGATHNIATSAGRRLRAIQDFSIYENGSVWIDTINGTPGTVDFENGTVGNPVDTLADAMTIAGSIGLSRFEIGARSALAFEEDMDGWLFNGRNYSIDFAGYDSNSLFIQGATVTGELTASGSVGMILCRLSDGCTLPSGGYSQCTLPGDITLAGSFYLFDQCVSVVAGTASPSIDLGSVGNQSINFRHFSGGIRVVNLGTNGTDNMSLEGFGQLIIDSTSDAASSTIAVRGLFDITDEVAGGFSGTLSDEARFDTQQVWGFALENARTANEVMNVISAVLAGKSDASGGVMKFYAADGVTVRLEVSVLAGERVSVDTWKGD
jgi:hypothetical protein